MNPQTTHRRPRPRPLLAAALVGGLLVAGCGSSGSDEGAKAAPSTTAEAQPDTGDATTTTATTATTESGGGDGSEDARGGSCDIVSDSVAAQVLGIEIVRREPHPGPGGKGGSCIKGTARGNDPSKFSFVNVSIVPGAGSTVVDDASAQGAEPVAGLGDRAVFLANAGVLFIVDGDDAIQVQVVKGGKPGSREDALTVAKDVMGRRG